VESDRDYAHRQVRQFKTDAVSQIVASGPGNAKLLVSRVQRSTPGHGFATPVRPDAVFSVLVQLRRQDRRELYLDGRLVHQGSFAKGTVSVVDHWQRPKANLLSAFDTIIFTVPQAALNAVVEQQGMRPVETLVCETEGRRDETIWSLANSLLPALERPDEVGSIYAERVLLAATTYFAHAFGGMRLPADAPHDLSSRQVNRSMEMMQAYGSADLPLSTLASELELSALQFTRAFRRTTGVTPDGWLRRQRIEQAKSLMRQTAMSIDEIARVCGFAGEAHFEREFAAVVGASPGHWRRQVLN
jgi:AraC-like DNA-binding protein